MITTISILLSNAFKKIKLFLLQNKFIFVSLLVAFGLNLINWIFLYIKVPRSVEFIPLHHNIYFGIDFMGEWYEMFIIPAVGLFIFIVNLILAVLIYNQEKIISYFLIGIAVLVQILFLINSMVVVFVNL